MSLKVQGLLSEEHFQKKADRSATFSPFGVLLSGMFFPLPDHLWNRYGAAHLLNRAGFGGTPEEIAQVELLGVKGAVESLLNADDDGDLFPSPQLVFPKVRFAYKQRMKSAATEETKQEIRKELNQAERTSMPDLRLWWLNRMRYSSNPLLEKATLFWHGHFATSNQKVNDPYLMWQQNETLRFYALGKFPDLLKAMSRDPAMIRWLDLESSRKVHPNENFAREVMELFSLGEGHYSERDVQEAARAFTGYRVDPKTAEFFWTPGASDLGQKTFLGKTGSFTGDQIIDLIVAQPQCARFLGKKLWSFFVAENPSEDVVQSVANLLLSNGYDIGATLGVIFRSADFYFAEFVTQQIKSPVQWLIQTTKSLEIGLPETRVIENSLATLGQVLFAPPNVKGWDGGRAWISASGLLYRYNLAAYLLSGKAHILGSGGTKTAVVPLEKIAPVSARSERQQLLDEVGYRIFNTPLPKKEKPTFLAYLEKHPTPYSDSVIRDLLQLMMSTPEFQLC
jgi:hypothetical protein